MCHDTPAKIRHESGLIAFPNVSVGIGTRPESPAHTRRVSTDPRDELEDAHMRREQKLVVSGGPLVLTVAAILCLTCSFVGCQGEGEQKKGDGEAEKPKVAKVSRVAKVAIFDLDCGTTETIWTGPPDSVVHVDLSGGDECPVSLKFHPRKDETHEKDTPTGDSADAKKTKAVSVKVPGTSNLACSCGGTAKSKCRCTITAVDPPLPEKTTLGATSQITPPAPVKDPPAGNVPPAGTPVSLTCGNEITLWSGKPSYVTVTLKGAEKCFAKLIPEKAGAPTGGGEEVTDTHPHSRTFGPITSLKANCWGPKITGGVCDFQVTEVIELP
jgi:hypothetical protein